MIYTKDNKQMKKNLGDFSKTNYGKCMFLICYSPFLLLTILTISTFILLITHDCWVFYSMTLVKFALATVCSFCLGSYGFYKELREYVNSTKSAKK